MAGKLLGNDIRCSFCNKTQNQVRKLIAGPAGVYICDDCIDEVLRILFNLKTEHYYAQMGIAWAVSICYIKYPDLTLNYLKDSTLDDFCHNKSISKIINISKKLFLSFRKLVCNIILFVIF